MINPRGVEFLFKPQKEPDGGGFVLANIIPGHIQWAVSPPNTTYSGEQDRTATTRKMQSCSLPTKKSLFGCKNKKTPKNAGIQEVTISPSECLSATPAPLCENRFTRSLFKERCRCK